MTPFEAAKTLSERETDPLVKILVDTILREHNPERGSLAGLAVESSMTGAVTIRVGNLMWSKRYWDGADSEYFSKGDLETLARMTETN